MGILGDRFLVYSALAILCGATSSILGPGAGIWSFVQIAVVIELTHWIGTHGGNNRRAAGK